MSRAPVLCSKNLRMEAPWGTKAETVGYVIYHVIKSRALTLSALSTDSAWERWREFSFLWCFPHNSVWYSPAGEHGSSLNCMNWPHLGVDPIGAGMASHSNLASGLWLTTSGRHRMRRQFPSKPTTQARSRHAFILTELDWRKHSGGALQKNDAILEGYLLFFFCGKFCFFWFLVLCFPVSLIFCFSASLLFCFSAYIASLLFLLLCFSAFCFPCSSAFPASLLFGFLLSFFFAFLLLCFPCFSVYVLLCLSTSTILLFLFFNHVFLLLYFLLLCFFASCLYCLFVFHFILLYSVLFVS